MTGRETGGTPVADAALVMGVCDILWAFGIYAKDTAPAAEAIVEAVRAAIEAEAREEGKAARDREHVLAVENADAFRAEPRAEGLDVERLRLALGVIPGRLVAAKGYPGDHHGVYWVDLDAVLKLLREPS